MKVVFYTSLKELAHKLAFEFYEMLVWIGPVQSAILQKTHIHCQKKVRCLSLEQYKVQK